MTARARRRLLHLPAVPRRVALALLPVLLALTVLVAGCQPPGSPSAPPDALPAAAATVDPESGLPFVEFEALPAEARRTVTLIGSGGPFPYSKDGSVFGNRERLLPVRERGFYQEYTVPTLGSRDRGARRIVAGEQGRQLYYTDDHYDSFRRVRR